MKVVLWAMDAENRLHITYVGHISAHKENGKKWKEFKYHFQDFRTDVFDLEYHLLQKLEASVMLPFRLNELW